MTTCIDRKHIKLQRGLTLIELMIAVTLGLMLIGAVMGVLLSSNRNYTQDDELARMQENGRFIMHRLDEEFTMAGYWGGATYVQGVDKTGMAFGTDCNVNFDPAIPATSVQISYDPTTFGGCITDHKPNTPIYVVKRALGTTVATQVAGEPYVISNDYKARIRLYNPGDPTTAPIAGEKARKYVARMYYIKNANANGDPVPTLYIRRMETTAGASKFVEYEAAEGIENISVDFGIDTDKNGIANYHTNTPAINELATAVSARIYILARAAAQDSEYKDEKVYVMGTTEIKGGGDQFRRRLFSKSLVMRNTAYMLQLNN